jgi:hypothetical protein
MNLRAGFAAAGPTAIRAPLVAEIAELSAARGCRRL